MFIANRIHNKNFVYITIYSLISEPCEKTYCAWGATCVVSESGRASCLCPMDCPLTPAPVCGNDDVTYTNQCHLRQTSCHNMKNNRVKHQGPCGESLFNNKFTNLIYKIL